MGMFEAKAVADTSATSIKNCRFLTRGENIFRFGDAGTAVTLNGYLIAPLELFSKRQLKNIEKRFVAQDYSGAPQDAFMKRDTPASA